MNKKLLIITIFLGAALLSVGLLLLKPSGEVVAPGSSSQTPDESSPTMSTQPASEISEGGLYIEYSDDAIAKASGRKLLFFHAPWCPQCRAIERDIESEGVPAGVTVIKVDYDSNQSLRKKYDVRLQTTFVEVNDSGEGINTYVAYDEPTFKSVKDYFL